MGAPHPWATSQETFRALEKRAMQSFCPDTVLRENTVPSPVGLQGAYFLSSQQPKQRPPGLISSEIARERWLRLVPAGRGPAEAGAPSTDGQTVFPAQRPPLSRRPQAQAPGPLHGNRGGLVCFLYLNPSQGEYHPGNTMSCKLNK